jgi:RES domain-containing protein
MLVYRISKTKYAEDLSGEGARRYGGRWNNKTVACVYTSESRALAILEYTANVNIEDIPRSLSITSLEIPDEEIFIVKEKDLPPNWQLSPAPSASKDYGSDLLLKAAHAVIKIPSVIIPSEYNYLLNPLHAVSRKFKIIEVNDFKYDMRLKG